MSGRSLRYVLRVKSITARAAIDTARNGASFFLARLTAQVAQLRSRTYPGHHPGPHKWLACVQGLIDTAVGYLAQAADAALTSDQAGALVADANLLGNRAYEALQRLEGSGADQIPHQVVGPFKRWVDGLGIVNDIFFRADHVPNYELATYGDIQSLAVRLNNPSATLTSAVSEITWPFLRITVPSQALGMLPHFAIVAHELGHAIQSRISPDLTAFAAAEQDSITRTTQRLANDGLRFGLQEQLERQRILARWQNEIIADAVGYYIAGPAFFFALGAFFELLGGGLGIGLWHPPSIVRRNLVVERLRAGAPSHATAFENATGLAITDGMNSPHLSGLPNPDELYIALKTHAQMHPIQAAICVELIPLIEMIAGAFYDETQVVLQATNHEMVYTPAQLEADLANHLDPLCQLIPPIEHREAGVPQASTLAGVLNVGWAVLLAKLNALPAGTSTGDDATAQKMEMLHQLLLKGVELSEARQTWEEI